jgi:glutaredoxin 3
MPHIEIYTQPWCSYCARALHLLNRKGLAYTEIEAPRGSPARAEAIRRSGGRATVPVIFIDGRPIGGSEELLAMEQAGELDSLLTAA